VRYAFIRGRQGIATQCPERRAHREEFSVRAMCRVLQVHFQRLLRMAWGAVEPARTGRRPADRVAPAGLAGERQGLWLPQALRRPAPLSGHCCAIPCRATDQGERVSENRVARLASLAGIAAQIGYRRRPGRYGGRPAVVAENRLEQRFEAAEPDQIWVTDITYIRTPSRT
jgi:putative transposase